MLRTLLLLAALSVAAASLAMDHPVYDLDGLEAEHLEFGGANAEEFMKGLSLIETEVELEAEAKGSSSDWSNIGNQPLSLLPSSQHKQMRKGLAALEKVEKERIANLLGTNKYGLYWLRKIAEAKEDAARAASTSDFLLNRINYQGNSYIYKKDPRGDPWKTPFTFVTDAGGDCEDYALLKLEALQRLGFSRSDMMIMIGRTKKNVLHAILLVRSAGKYWILDNMYRAKKFEYSDFVRSTGWKFWYMFNHESMWMMPKTKSGESASTVVRRVTVDKKDYGPCTNHAGSCLHLTWCEQKGHSWVSGACPGLPGPIRCCYGSTQSDPDVAEEESYVIRIQPMTMVAKGSLDEKREAMCMFSTGTGDVMDLTNTVDTEWTSKHRFGQQMLVLPYKVGEKLFGRCYARECTAGECGATSPNPNDLVVATGSLEPAVDVQVSMLSTKFHQFMLGKVEFEGKILQAFTGVIQVALNEPAGDFL